MDVTADGQNAQPTAQPPQLPQALQEQLHAMGQQTAHTQNTLQQLVAAVQPLLAWFATTQRQQISPDAATATNRQATANAPADLALPSALRLPKLEPADGRNSRSLPAWFDRARGRLEASGTNLNSRAAVHWVASHFTGVLGDWWSAQQKTSDDFVAAGFSSFEALRKGVLASYRIKDEATDARQRLARLTQTGSVEDYCQKTLSLNAYLPTRQEDDRIHLFVTGLKPFEKDYVVRGRPTTLSDAIRLATEASSLYDRVHSGETRRRTMPRADNSGPTPMDLNAVDADSDADADVNALGAKPRRYSTTRNLLRPRIRTDTTQEERDECRKDCASFARSRTTRRTTAPIAKASRRSQTEGLRRQAAACSALRPFAQRSLLRTFKCCNRCYNPCSG